MTSKSAFYYLSILLFFGINPSFGQQGQLTNFGDFECRFERRIRGSQVSDIDYVSGHGDSAFGSASRAIRDDRHNTVIVYNVRWSRPSTNRIQIAINNGGFNQYLHSINFDYWSYATPQEATYILEFPIVNAPIASGPVSRRTHWEVAVLPDYRNNNMNDLLYLINNSQDSAMHNFLRNFFHSRIHAIDLQVSQLRNLLNRSGRNQLTALQRRQNTMTIAANLAARARLQVLERAFAVPSPQSFSVLTNDDNEQSVLLEALSAAVAQLYGNDSIVSRIPTSAVNSISSYEVQTPVHSELTLNMVQCRINNVRAVANPAAPAPAPAPAADARATIEAGPSVNESVQPSAESVMDASTGQ